MPRRRNGAPAPENQGGYRAQPLRAPTGLPYGEHQARIEAQRQLPLPNTALEPRALEAAAQIPPPNGGLAAPTGRPGEPVTAGLSIGPGSNQAPAVLAPQPNPDLALWEPWMPMLELLVSQPGASVETRQFYRRLRAQLPETR